MSQIAEAVLDEVQRAEAKFPKWPYDPLHAAAIIQEEVGELQKAILQYTYESGKSSREDIRDEAIQVAAMALRFLNNLEGYVYEERW